MQQRFITIEGFNVEAKNQLMKQLQEKCAAENQEKISYTIGGHILAIVLLKFIFGGNPLFSTAVVIFYLSGCITYYLRETPKFADLFYFKVKRGDNSSSETLSRQIVFLEETSIEWCTDENGKNIDNSSTFAYFMLKMHDHISMIYRASQEYPDAIIVITNSIITDSAVFMEAFYEFQEVGGSSINEIEYKVYKRWFCTIYDSNREIFDNMRHIYIDGVTPHGEILENLRSDSVVNSKFHGGSDNRSEIGTFHMFCKKRYEEVFEKHNSLIASLKLTETDDNGKFSSEDVNSVLRAIRGAAP